MPITTIENGLNTEHAVIGAGVHLAQVLGNKSEEAPLHCGSYKMDPGSETTIDYPCTIFVLVLEGEFTVEDTANPGVVRTVKKGDIFNTNKGTSVKWGSPAGGQGFYVIQLPGGVDPTPYFNQ